MGINVPPPPVMFQPGLNVGDIHSKIYGGIEREHPWPREPMEEETLHKRGCRYSYPPTGRGK